MNSKRRIMIASSIGCISHPAIREALELLEDIEIEDKRKLVELTLIARPRDTGEGFLTKRDRTYPTLKEKLRGRNFK